MKVLFYCMILLCAALLQTSCNTHKHLSTSNYNVDKSFIWGDPHKMPHYLNGGDKGLLSDLYTTLSKTAPVTLDSVNGRVAVNCQISKDGIIDPNSIKIIRNWSVPDDYINASIEAIKSLGKFEPGELNGTPIKVRYTIIIRYPIPIDYIKTSE